MRTKQIPADLLSSNSNVRFVRWSIPCVASHCSIDVHFTVYVRYGIVISVWGRCHRIYGTPRGGVIIGTNCPVSASASQVPRAWTLTRTERGRRGIACTTCAAAVIGVQFHHPRFAIVVRLVRGFAEGHVRWDVPRIGPVQLIPYPEWAALKNKQACRQNNALFLELPFCSFNFLRTPCACSPLKQSTLLQALGRALSQAGWRINTYLLFG